MSDVDVQHAWGRIRKEMRRAVGDSTWQLWLEPLVARHLEEETLVIEAPAESRAWIEDIFAACTAEERRKVLVENPCRYFGLDPDADLTPTPTA